MIRAMAIQRQEREKRKNVVVGLILGFLFEISLLVVPVSGQASTENPLLSTVKLHVSGYTQVLYSWWEEGVDSFLVKRARLSLSGEIARKIKFKLQADAVKSPILLDAQVDFEFSPSIGLRIGQFYVPFGRENRTSSSEIETILRSQVVDKLAPSRDIGSPGRDIGAMVFGKFSAIEYMAGFFNGSGVNKTDTNENKDFSARVVLRPAAFISIGGSLYNGRHSPAQGDRPFTRDRVGIEAGLDMGAFSARTEYISGQENQTKRDGWYVQGSYFVLEKKVQAVIKWDSYDQDKDAASDRSDLLTLGINWFFSEKTKLQVNFNSYRRESGETANRAVLVQFQAGF
ncbi:MAG: porin [Clostridiales bacterium]|nr:porin [Clostridiales bacterium]